MKARLILAAEIDLILNSLPLNHLLVLVKSQKAVFLQTSMYEAKSIIIVGFEERFFVFSEAKKHSIRQFCHLLGCRCLHLNQQEIILGLYLINGGDLK